MNDILSYILYRAGDAHGPLCRALLHCCSASDQYAVALCGPTGSIILRNLLQAYWSDKEASGDNSQVSAPQRRPCIGRVHPT